MVSNQHPLFSVGWEKFVYKNSIFFETIDFTTFIFWRRSHETKYSFYRSIAHEVYYKKCFESSWISCFLNFLQSIDKCTVVWAFRSEGLILYQSTSAPIYILKDFFHLWSSILWLVSFFLTNRFFQFSYW